MAAFSKNPASARAVDMQVMDLPAVVQTQAEVAAFSDGRSQLTFDYEPHAVYGVLEGDIVIAQAQGGGERVALRVQGQHRIDARLAAQLGAAQRWADLEKSSPSALFQKVATAHSEDKQLWGLRVEPMGTYDRGQITPFPVPEQSQPLAAIAAENASVSTRQEHQEPPIASNLYERYGSQYSGVMAAVAASNPKLQQQLDSFMAKRAIADGHSGEAVQDAISRHSPAAQQSGQPNVYAKNVVTQVKRETAQSTNPTPKQRTQSQGQNRAKRVKAKDNGMGY